MAGEQHGTDGVANASGPSILHNFWDEALIVAVLFIAFRVRGKKMDWRMGEEGGAKKKL